MNKKILLSTAAAVVLAVGFTGCGSSGSSSGSSVAGAAVKADLVGATVNVGGTTTTTGADGSFSLTAPAGSTDVEITGGNYTLNGVQKTNSTTLKATTAQVNAGAPVSMFTTLVKEFDGNVTKAANILNISLPAGLDMSDATAVNEAIKNVDVGDFEKAAVAIALTLETATNKAAIITALDANATAGKQDISALTTALSAVAAEETKAALTAIQENKPLGYVLALSDDNTTTYDAAEYTISNVINLDGNTSADDNNATAFYSVGTIPTTGGLKANGLSAITSNPNDMDNNTTLISFGLTDYNATLENANGNVSLFIRLSGLDAANSNNSYVMGLTGLDLDNTNDVLTLDATADMVLKTMAKSDKAYKYSVGNANASVLNANDSFLADNASKTGVNISRFKNYMDSLYVDENTTETGNYTLKMSHGNYSLKVYVDIDGQKMSTDDRLTDLISSSMTETTDSGTTLFSGKKAYKVLDANLTY